MNIYGMTFSETKSYFEKNNENKAKAKIIFNELYKKRISDFSDIVCLSGRVREILKRDFSLQTSDFIKLVEKKEGRDVSKLLFILNDGNMIESVLMKHDYGNALCISTQVGCNMGCTFCESGRLKKVRDLEPFEMVLQILETEKHLKTKINSVTLMGIGEPLDNYENTIRFVNIINTQHGLDIASRHITVSTCGIIPKIERLLKENVPCNLAVSLHAPNDNIRNNLMPVNKVCGLKELINTVKNYSEVKNKKTALEYILLKGINDSDICAKELVELVKGVKCYVNLIPYNETGVSGFLRPEKDRIKVFYDILIKGGVRATVRREFGGEFKAACGQLRSDYGI